MTALANLHLGTARSWQRALLRPSTLAALAVLVALAVVWVATFVITAQPTTLDQRVHDVGAQLRCPTCNGETVADASTPVAQQMRVVIRQKLAAGESEQQVIADFRASYGDSILASPPASGFTIFIWLGPILMLLASIAVVVLAGREWRVMAASAVAHDEDADEDAQDELGALAPGDPTERERLRAVLRRELEAEEGLPLATPEEGR